MSPSLNSHYSLLIGLNTPWKVSKVNLEIEQSCVVIEVAYGSKKLACPDCGKVSPQRDCAPSRRWRHLDTMNFETIIEARVPRCNCPDCGVRTATVPWAGRHSRFTLMFEAFAIEVLQMAKSLEAGRLLLGLSWDSAQTIMKRAVERGLASRDVSGVEEIGIDELQSDRHFVGIVGVIGVEEEGRVFLERKKPLPGNRAKQSSRANPAAVTPSAGS